MKVIKPGQLAVLTRCFEHGRRFYMGASVMSFIPLGSTDTLLHEVAMWKFVAERLGEAALDVGVPKSRGEYLVNASAYAPEGVAVPNVPVRAIVGPLQKDLYVFGDRFWKGSTATEAQPITSLPLDWAHAFGGEGYVKNPLGKGSELASLHGVEIQPLPNVESPAQLVDSPRDRPEPAGFGPLDISWPQRNSLAGTYDTHWLENLFPGYARDIDWGIHNIAAPDQQREGFWEGGESYAFYNLHPSKAALTGELPRFKARVFINRSHRPGQPRPPHAQTKAAVKLAPTQLEEIPLELQTLWFFPDAEYAVLIWQGSIAVAEEDGADVLHLVAAAEHADRPRTTDYYVDVAASRFDPEFGPLASLREHELLPEDLGEAPSPTDEDAALNATEGLRGGNMHRRMVAEIEKTRAYVASFGLDPDVHGPAQVAPPTTPPTAQELPALIAKVKAEELANKAELEAKKDAAQAEIDKIVDDAGIEGFTSETLHEEQQQTQVGPPKWTAAAIKGMLAGEAMAARSRGVIVDELEEMLVDEELYARWEEAEVQMFAIYRKQAHRQTPAPPMPPELAEPTRARVRAAVAGEEDFATINLTGADLRGMSLAGVNLRGAFLESAQLDGVDLRGAVLSGATLAHASLVGTQLDEAKLDEANLGKAKLSKTVLRGADLTRAVLCEAILDHTVLAGATLIEAELLGAHLSGVDAQGVEAPRSSFIELELEAVDFRGAKLSESVFVATDLRGSVFDQATLTSVTFLDCKAQGVSFIGADLGNARFVEGTVLDGAVLTEASLVSANLRGISLAGADLRKAVLDKADMCECDLSGAKLYQVLARETKFEVADLREAEMMSGNFMHASFARAAIYGADLRGANLHGADMARVRSDPQVQLDHALLTKVRVHPRHVEPSSEESGS